MSVADQLKALLERVETRRTARCERLIEKASENVERIVQTALKDARKRIAAVVKEERDLLDEELIRARARLLTEARHRRQRHQAELLRAAHERLRQVLTDRWHHDKSRHRWLESVARQALARLPPGVWTLSRGADWGDEDQQRLLAVIDGHAGIEPEFLLNQQIEAGLMIESAGLVIDGSLAALMADRTLIDARLLALLEPDAGQI